VRTAAPAATSPRGSGTYICCAGDPITWRCNKCQKVYEGFAFPYGMCAACGGPLMLADAQAVESMGTRSAISQAFEIELGGMAFYGRGAQSASDPSSRSCARVCTRWSRSISRPEPALPRGAPWPAGRRADAHPDGGVRRRRSRARRTGADVLQLALKLEERARDFFSEQASKLPDGSPEWRLYRELEAEEFDHVATIATELERYQEGKPGLL